MNKTTKKLAKRPNCQTAKYKYLESCDECEKKFCQNYFDKKSIGGFTITLKS